MTDVSSRGLIPQLTDVLYALTNSHELLLFKIQALRREPGVDRMVIDQPVHTEFLDLADSRPPALVVAKSGETNGAYRPALMDHVGRTNRSAKPALTEADACSVAVTDEQATEAESETQLPTHTPTEVVVPRRDTDAAPARPSTSPELPAKVHSDPTDGASADRNYNFFDELDARLTHIQDLDVGSGEQGSSQHD